jgi:hypothetical protein
MWVPPRNAKFFWRPLGPLTSEEKLEEDWIKLAKDILIHIQLRDNLEKTLVVEDHNNDRERRILIKPNSIKLEEGLLASEVT